MKAIKNIKWIKDDYLHQSECGRFEIEQIGSSKADGFSLSVDDDYYDDYPTLSKAKAVAKDILKNGI